MLTMVTCKDMKDLIAKIYSFLSHTDGATHFQQIGNDLTAEFIVFVCGATLPMGVWEPIITPLSNQGVNIIRYDLPGRGHSPVTDIGTSFEAHLTQLDLLIKKLAPKQKITLVGLASGALIVSKYASVNSDRVARTILVAPDGAKTHFTLKEKVLALPLIGEVLFNLNAKSTLLSRVPRYSTKPKIQKFVTELLNFSLRSKGFNAAVLETVRDFPLKEGLFIYEDLAKSKVKTKVIWGEEDLITPLNELNEFINLFGKENVVKLKGVGHLPFVEKPQEFVDLML